MNNSEMNKRLLNKLFGNNGEECLITKEFLIFGLKNIAVYKNIVCFENVSKVKIEICRFLKAGKNGWYITLIACDETRCCSIVFIFKANFKYHFIQYGNSMKINHLSQKIIAMLPKSQRNNTVLLLEKRFDKHDSFFKCLCYLSKFVCLQDILKNEEGITYNMDTTQYCMKLSKPKYLP